MFRSCSSAASRLKVTSLTYSRSRSIHSRIKVPSKTVSLGLCAAGSSAIGAAIWFNKDKIKDVRPMQTIATAFDQTFSALNWDNVWKNLFGSVTAQKKKSTSLPPCGGKMKKKLHVTCQECQPIILSPNATHSLYLWICLDPGADQCEVARIACDMDALIASVDDPCEPGAEEIVAGVGFGPNFYSQVMGKTNKNYYYGQRKCCHGELPSSGGDILLHVKCNDRGKLFEICKNYLYSFPESSIREYEDLYGYDYKCGRDLSNFCVNASNPCDEAGMKEVAVECQSGGSYALAMKWVHDFSVLRPENKDTLEKYIGRDMCGEELKCKTETCHVTRMRGCADEGATPCYEAVMHKQSFGSLSKGAGLFTLGFASDPANFEFMLDRMVGSSCDGCHDDIFKISKNVKGSYFFFPGIEDLHCLKTAGK